MMKQKNQTIVLTLQIEATFFPLKTFEEKRQDRTGLYSMLKRAKSEYLAQEHVFIW
jgi:hypothetical protein